MCGEQICWTISKRAALGSPPRVRGTGRIPSGLGVGLGITPACAGNSMTRICPARWRRDHPRVCGEQSFFNILHNNRIGSPPRVRGTGGKYPEKAAIDGITPACAGNSQREIPIFSAIWDHPRVCGEQLLPFAMGLYLLGSPPRVRGTAKRAYL